MRILQNVLIYTLATLLILVGMSQTAQAQALPAPVLREAFPLPDGAPAPDPDPDPDPTPGGTVTFTEDKLTDIRNPERGFYRTGEIDLAGGTTPNYAKFYDTYRQTLGYDRVKLANYVNMDHLPATFIQNMKKNLAAMRGTGLKAVIRFYYSGEIDQDATKARQLNHIADVAPILKEYSDVIAYIEAGFIGQYGEWHDSRYIGNNPDDPEDVRDMSDIAQALLDAVPTNRLVGIRTPRYLMALFGDTPSRPQDAFNGSDRARVFPHVDGMFSNKTHGYTINASEYDVQFAWLAAQSGITLIAGETNGVGGTCTNAVDSFICRQNSDCTSRHGSNSSCDMHWSGCPTAKAEAARIHLTALNDRVHTPWPGAEVPDRWQSEGCYEEIKRKMGYRFVLKSATFVGSVNRGSSFGFSVTLRNDGYGRVYNPRTAYLTLKTSTTRRDIALNSDPRSWDPGAEETITQQIAIPADLPTGTYEVSLWLPDAAATLRNDSKYAIRFANNGIWNQTLGLNRLGTIDVK